MWFYKCFSFGYIIFHILVFCEDNMKQHKNNRRHLNADLNIYKNITEAKKKLQEVLNNFKNLEKVYKKYENTDSDPGESENEKVFRQISKTNKSKRKHSKKQTFTTSNPNNKYRGTAHIYEYQESSVLGHEDAKDEKEQFINANEEAVKEDSLESNAKTEVSSEKISGSDEIHPKTESDEVVEIKIEPEKIIKNKPQSHVNNRDKTRFSVLHSGKDNINVISNKSEIFSKVGNQRVVHTEQFPPETIWHEIINRPIKLNRVISSEEKSKLNSRKNENNTEIGITDKTKKENTTKILDDLETQKLSDIARTGNSILRDAYGDVCIQMPMKKCKKAVKAVSKNVCKRRFKCHSEFKSDFDENLKKECVKKFSYNYTESKEFNYSVNRAIKDDYQFLDATRHKDPHRLLSLNETQISLIQLSLRDKYEKRCQKESRENCITACNDGTEKTCSKHTCDKKKNKAMTRTCKEECKKIFLIDDQSSISSDDSSDSDSDSD